MNITARMERFEARLRNELTSDVEFISAISENLIGAGGKRMRPQLAFLTAELLGVDPGYAETVAVAIEMLHSASLLHDDLIDDAETRRGSEAAFRRYGAVVSVMAGDFMLAQVLRVLAISQSSALTGLLARTATAVCEGEVLQFQVATLEDYSFEQYYRIIDGKTAELIAAAIEGVGILAGATTHDVAALREFGLHYGRAFQLQDDYLDLLGNEQQLGKPVGGDVREGKATHYALTLLLQHKVEEVRSILRREGNAPGDIQRMQELVRQYGADNAHRAAITAEIDRANRALHHFPDSPARAALSGFVTKELERRF